MKVIRCLLYFYLFCFSLPALAIYDLVSINVTPKTNETEFCFYLDSKQHDALYLAFSQDYQNLTFIDENQDYSIFDGSHPAYFLKKDNPKSLPMNAKCFTKITLNTKLSNMQLYAVVAEPEEDVVKSAENNALKYVRFFDGFASLPEHEKQWTVMVYMVGSDLEYGLGSLKGAASQDILEMVQGSAQLTQDNVNLVLTTGGSTRQAWKTVKRSVIQNGQQYVLEDLGKQNMGQPETLSNFVTWATQKFPAQHYALILWDHGVGAKGIGKDTNWQGDVITLPELKHAYQDILIQNNKLLDTVIYDACLMGSIEVADVTSNIALTMAASAELEPSHGLDYQYLLTQIAAESPQSGIDFNTIAKTGYIEHAKNKKTYNTSQITYSILDLTKMPQFRTAFSQFTTTFKDTLQQKGTLNYQNLSRGIIRAPAYPYKKSSGLSIAATNSTFSSTTGIVLDSLHKINDTVISIDLYNILQTVDGGLGQFKQDADNVLAALDQLITDYETNENVKQVKTDAGRISINIDLSYTDYLSVLPEPYQQFHDGLVYYDERRQQDSSRTEGNNICFNGAICAFAQWLELYLDDVLGIEAYYGQQIDGNAKVHLIEHDFYTYQTEQTQSINLPVDGYKACQYQLCNEQSCEDITVSKHHNLLTAEVILNESPAILTFCPLDNEQWSVCQVVQQYDGIWGRDSVLYGGENITPLLMTLSQDVRIQATVQKNQPFNVEQPNTLFLKRNCDIQKASVWALHYGNSSQATIDLLCDDADCVCTENDTDEGCQNIGHKAGVFLNVDF
ncbi:MAG: clostripain-related cysteine peptidase [Thiotrichaceae bacterium]|nr:clostripain-related cysteine peptidase [Thiotrichaceae bacterium]